MNKTALITGATSGIGYEMAKILAKNKYNLLLVSRNKQKLTSIKADFESKYSIEVVFKEVDLSIPCAAQKVYDMVITDKIKIDILINNSGFANYGEHTNISIKENYKLLQLNIIALSEMCTLFGADMKSRKTGKILNIASTAAYQPTPYFAAYGASKSYVLNFSEALAKELEDYNVSVTCLSPGPTETNFFTVAKMNDINISHMNKRLSAKKVAEVGINALFDKKLSIISDFKSKFLVFSNRFAPRSIVANISKTMMKSK